jgi:hypothetical protein
MLEFRVQWGLVTRSVLRAAFCVLRVLCIRYIVYLGSRQLSGTE